MFGDAARYLTQQNWVKGSDQIVLRGLSGCRFTLIKQIGAEGLNDYGVCPIAGDKGGRVRVAEACLPLGCAMRMRHLFPIVSTCIIV